MMLNSMLIVMLVGPAQAPERPRVRPAAMVLDLKGGVEIRPADGPPKAAALGDLLYPGESLAVPADGAATVAILGAGLQQALKPGSAATIGPKGCSPPEAVAATKAQKPAVARTMRNVRPATPEGRTAGVVSRHGAEAEPLAILPIDDSTVAADRPGLSWPAARGATSYRVKLRSGAGRELWKLETKGPHADFPADKPPLERGHVFRWEVTDQDFRPVAAGEFTVATDSERQQLEELKALTDSPDRADRLAVALAYRRLGAYAEAITAFERLAQESPAEPILGRALDELRRQAGRGKPPGPASTPKPKSSEGR
jgi:hypothetical protein